MTTMLVRERPSLRQYAVVTTPSGKRYRWAEDEHDAANVPSDVRHSDTMPGGFETFDATLPRKPGTDYSDLERLSDVVVTDAGGSVVWEGRLERAPRVSGEQLAISPSAVGYQAHLEDDKSARMIYRDIDLSRWAGASVARKIAANATFRVFDPSTGDNAGAPTLRTNLNGPWAVAPGRPLAEAWYDGHGLPIGSLYYGWTRSANVNAADANWSWSAQLSLDDVASATDSSGNLRAAGPGTGTVTATTATRVFAIVNLNYGNVAAGDQREYAIDWDSLAVYGNHGLTLRGTEPDAGFYDADIIGHAIGQWCPLLVATPESVTPGTFVIPQSAFHDPTTVAEIVRQTTRYGLRDWAVWEDRTFWLHDRGARGRRWRARVAPAQLEETGPQADRLWESVIVQYQDVDGSTRTVGPPGSGADTEDSTLKDTDPENPANKAGIVRRDLLVMGVSTVAGATETGRRFLEESKLLDTSGRARFVGYVEDDRGVVHPYTTPRAGDDVCFVDAPDTSYRRIVRADKSRADRTCSIDIDSPPEGLQALLERLAVVLIPLGL